MATIKALEGRTVHQIQSGQVIVDLCSVVKELVENSLDAGATSIDVRFKSNGLQSIEVQDNGIGIAPENYDSVALKHYTSKLSSYNDLDSLQTFGFRGEALSSLCALSNFHIVTARAQDVPKGTRLDFETSGKLSGITVVASQKGTLVVVENLFTGLPVRRRDLEKNVKREYGKVLGLIQAYACISVNVKISVSNVMANGRKMTAFATKSNPSTRENIANVFGAKALNGLLAMNLALETKQTRRPSATEDGENQKKQVMVEGHVSRPIFGEGRQQPDRQMFFVNTRPCGLPQVAKVFNEVYKSYNLSQSPFIFANIILDTNAYDVNVSPDKRTILLHDQDELLENLRTSLIELFDNQDQTVPQSQYPKRKLPQFRQLTVQRSISSGDVPDSPSELNAAAEEEDNDDDERSTSRPITSLIESFATRDTEDRRNQQSTDIAKRKGSDDISHGKQKVLRRLTEQNNDKLSPEVSSTEQGADQSRNSEVSMQHAHDLDAPPPLVEDREKQGADSPADNPQPTQRPMSTAPSSSIIQNAYNRTRPRRMSPEVAEVTIGDETTVMTIGPTASKVRKPNTVRSGTGRKNSASQTFSSSLKAFAAPGTQMESEDESEEAESGEEEDQEEDGMNKYYRSDEGDREIEGDTDGHIEDVVEGPMPGKSKEQPTPDLDGLGSASDNEDDPGRPNTAQDEPGSDGSDDEYLDDATKKHREDARVARLIQEAEEAAAQPTQDNVRRAHNILKGAASNKDTTRDLILNVDASLTRIQTQQRKLRTLLEQALASQPVEGAHATTQSVVSSTTTPEDRLSLTVSKSDFPRMHIIGQFNLGFILALRTPPAPADTADIHPSTGRTASSSTTTGTTKTTDLFIIDQHASDEKINFERLQRETIMQTQRLVNPLPLDLTAVEEETILENMHILEANGFKVTIADDDDEDDGFAENGEKKLAEGDQEGETTPRVGRRCKLTSLPMAHNYTFSTRDLEELIALLADSPSSHIRHHPQDHNNITNSTDRYNYIPRPSKIRSLLASRACRSSIMIGKSLTKAQMRGLVGRMGRVEKPWNCPHGRPTMRHLVDLGELGMGMGMRRTGIGGEWDGEGEGEGGLLGRIRGWWEDDGGEGGEEGEEEEEEAGDANCEEREGE